MKKLFVTQYISIKYMLGDMNNITHQVFALKYIKLPYYTITLGIYENCLIASNYDTLFLRIK